MGAERTVSRQFRGVFTHGHSTDLQLWTFGERAPTVYEAKAGVAIVDVFNAGFQCQVPLVRQGDNPHESIPE